MSCQCSVHRCTRTIFWYRKHNWMPKVRVMRSWSSRSCDSIKCIAITTRLFKYYSYCWYYNFLQFYILIFFANLWNPTQCVCIYFMHFNLSVQYCTDSPMTVKTTAKCSYTTIKNSSCVGRTASKLFLNYTQTLCQIMM